MALRESGPSQILCLPGPKSFSCCPLLRTHSHPTVTLYSEPTAGIHHIYCHAAGGLLKLPPTPPGQLRLLSACAGDVMGSCLMGGDAGPWREVEQEAELQREGLMALTQVPAKSPKPTQRHTRIHTAPPLPSERATFWSSSRKLES